MENIIADIHRLGLRFDKLTYTSDYFPQLKECGERMIKAGACGRAEDGQRLGGGGLMGLKLKVKSRSQNLRFRELTCGLDWPCVRRCRFWLVLQTAAD